MVSNDFVFSLLQHNTMFILGKIGDYVDYDFRCGSLVSDTGYRI